MLRWFSHLSKFYLFSRLLSFTFNFWLLREFEYSSKGSLKLEEQTSREKWCTEGESRLTMWGKEIPSSKSIRNLIWESNPSFLPANGLLSPDPSFYQLGWGKDLCSSSKSCVRETKGDISSVFAFTPKLPTRYSSSFLLLVSWAIYYHQLGKIHSFRSAFLRNWSASQMDFIEFPHSYKSFYIAKLNPCLLWLV